VPRREFGLLQGNGLLHCSTWQTLRLTLQVGWLKAQDQTILALHNRVITHNQRVHVDHEEKRAWKLRIRDVEESDRGCYMCQINTKEMKKQIGCIDVLSEGENGNDFRDFSALQPQIFSVAVDDRKREEKGRRMGDRKGGFLEDSRRRRRRRRLLTGEEGEWKWESLEERRAKREPARIYRKQSGRLGREEQFSVLRMKGPQDVWFFLLHFGPCP